MLFQSSLTLHLVQERCFVSKSPAVCSVHAAVEGVAQKIQHDDIARSEVRFHKICCAYICAPVHRPANVVADESTFCTISNRQSACGWRQNSSVQLLVRKQHWREAGVKVV